MMDDKILENLYEPVTIEIPGNICCGELSCNCHNPVAPLTVGASTGLCPPSNYSDMVECQHCHSSYTPDNGIGMCPICFTVIAERPTTATRHNAGKVDYTLIPVDAMEGEARVWMMGEVKYGRDNWQKLWGDETVNVVMASMMRHCAAILRGEDIDPESGEHHASHIRCNAAMLIRHYNNSKGGTTCQ